MTWALLGCWLAVRAIEAQAVERCRLVAVEPTTQSAVVATALDELAVVHAGEDVPPACGPFRVAEVLPDRVVLEPAPAAGSAVRQVWLPLSADGASAEPVVLGSSPEPGERLTGLVSPVGDRRQPGKGGRQVRVEKPPP